MTGLPAASDSTSARAPTAVPRVAGWRHRVAAWPVGWTEFVIVGAWVALQATVNSLSVASDLARHGIGFRPAEPWIWEWTGGVSALLLLGPVLALDTAVRTRLRSSGLRLLAYGIGSVAYSVLHVAAMVAARKTIYAVRGWPYDFGPWPAGLVYEYRKDAFGFLLMVAGAAALRRLKGRAARPTEPVATRSVESMNAGTAVSPPTPALPDPVFIVRTAEGDRVIRASEVDWIEAQGNYVALHVGADLRLLRQTLAETEARLAGHGFIRTHRRSLVNRQRIELILPPGSGEPGVRLIGGAVVPLSESRRGELVRLVRGE